MNILHLSDFHMNKNYEQSKKKLNNLAEHIVAKLIKIKIVVFTGDMVDAPSIKKEVISNLAEKHPEILKKGKKIDKISEDLSLLSKKHHNDYNKEVKAIYIKHMTKAASIFNDFLHKIGVPYDHVVICCGNHDVVQLFGNEQKCLLEKEINETSTFKSDFEAFDCLCNKLNLDYNHDIFFKTIEGIDFLICNTNFLSSKKYGACFNCNNTIKEILKITSSSENNIFVSHQPLSEFCEDNHYDYRCKFSTQNISDTVNKLFCATLFGDKHAIGFSKTTGSTNISSGKPLSEDKIVYNMYYFDKVKTELNISKMFYYNEKTWEIKPNYILIENELKNTEKYFSNLTKRIPQYKCEYNSISKLDCEKISSLFMSFCKIKNVRKGDISLSKNIFSFIYDYISIDANTKFVLRGASNMGKSLFMDVLYLYLLSEYAQGHSNLFPLIINLDKLINNKDISLESFNDTVLAEIDKLILHAEEIKQIQDCNVVFILDGMMTNNIYDASKDPIEKQLFNLLKNYKLIMAFAKNDFFEQPLTVKTESIMSEYVLYFNHIDLINLDQSINKVVSLMELINEIFELGYSSSEISDSYNNLLNLHLTNTSFRNIYRYLKKYKNNSFSSYNNYYEEISKHIIDFFDVEKIGKVAFLIMFCGKTYADISAENKELIFYDFWKLKNNPEFVWFACANYYVKSLIDYTEYINEESILNYFIPRSVALLIVETISSVEYIKLVQESFKRIADQKIKVHNITLSMFYYLAGHITKIDIDIIDNIEPIDKPMYEISKEKFYEFCYCRSKYISRIVRACAADKFNSEMENLFNELIKSEKFREQNRMYQILYYGDNSFYGLNGRNFYFENDIVQQGFDFHNTFLTLIAKLDYWKTNEGRSYELKIFDLFTICDFVYSRLLCTKTKDGKNTFFYYHGYNATSRLVLEKVVYYIKEFTSKNISINKGFIQSYFINLSRMFNDVLQEMNKNYSDKEDITKPYIYPTYELEKIFYLENIPRIGWNINNEKNVSSKTEDKLNNSSAYHERIIDHIFETAIIAALFLPPKIPKNILEKNAKKYYGYNKEKIISIILMHENGKSSTMDYTPKSANLYDHNNVAETTYKSILTLGSTAYFADMFEWYKDFRDFTSNFDSNINFRIAYEINIIQREYKYRKLLSLKKIKFNKSRMLEFESDFGEVNYTEISQSIRKILIEGNPDFKKD